MPYIDENLNAVWENCKNRIYDLKEAGISAQTALVIIPGIVKLFPSSSGHNILLKSSSFWLKTTKEFWADILNDEEHKGLVEYRIATFFM